MAETKILIVEDEGITAKHIQQALQGLGYKVVDTTAYGEEAVEKAKDLRPDLVLMDIMLKGDMDGVEAAELIRKQLGLPVVYLTASSDKTTFQRAKITEPFGYILKPFEENSLQMTIEMALYKHEMESKGKQREEELEALYAVSRILAQSWSFEEKCKGVLEALTQIASSDMTVMRVPDGDSGGLSLVSSTGRARLDRPETLSLENTISGLAYRNREAVVVEDYPSHPLAEKTAVAQGVKSLVSFPIRTERWTLGVVNVASTKPDNFPPKVVRLLSGIVDGLGTI